MRYRSIEPSLVKARNGIVDFDSFVGGGRGTKTTQYLQPVSPMSRSAYLLTPHSSRSSGIKKAAYHLGHS